jgi:hypothetical protein
MKSTEASSRLKRKRPDLVAPLAAWAGAARRKKSACASGTAREMKIYERPQRRPFLPIKIIMEI